MSSNADKTEPTAIRVVRLRWGDMILACGKCLKRHDDGKTLRRVLKAVG